MGSILGGGSAKKAAKENAKAIRDQTRLNVVSANMAAEAAANQMAQAQAQRIATKYAEDLLATPQEAAKVNLATEANANTEEGLVTRRRGVRAAYQSQPRNSGLSIL